MTRQEKSTLAPAVSDRIAFPVRNRESQGRPSAKYGALARAVAPALVIVLATLSCPAPVLAGAFTASGLVEQTFRPQGSPGVSSSGPTSASFLQQYVDGNLYLYSTASASSGTLSLFALASMSNMTDWSSGFVSSVARGSIVESVAPFWQSWLAPGESFIFDYEFRVTGALLTHSGGFGAGGSSAGLAYAYRVGDSSGGGNWSQNSAGQVSQSGVWNGVVKNSFTVHKDSTFDLELAAVADAGGGKLYNPESNATLFGIGDFSHTLTWLGITGVQAFDSLGNEIPLPPDFYLPLIGQESGFDYWHSAAGEPSEIPEPASALLLGAGLVVGGLIRQSGVRRRDL